MAVPSQADKPQKPPQKFYFQAGPAPRGQVGTDFRTWLDYVDRFYGEDVAVGVCAFGGHPSEVFYTSLRKGSILPVYGYLY